MFLKRFSPTSTSRVQARLFGLHETGAETTRRDVSGIALIHTEMRNREPATIDDNLQTEASRFAAETDRLQL